MPRHPSPATPTSPSLVARLAVYEGFNTIVTVRLISGLCGEGSPLNPNAVLVGIIARLTLWPSAYRWIFHSPQKENRDHFELKANLRLLMVFLFDLDRSPLEISLFRLIWESHVGFILGALLKILLYESLDYDDLGPKPGFFAPIATAFKSITMFALDLLADICGTPKRTQRDEFQVQCDPFTCLDMNGATLPIDDTQRAPELEIPCQYPYALNEVVIDGFLYSLVASYPLSQAPSLYSDMSPSLNNGDSDIDIPVALDNLRYNLSQRSEAHNKSRTFDGAHSKTSSYPEKADSNFEGVAFETHASSADTAPSTTSGTPVLPLYPPVYAPSDQAAADDHSPATETSVYDTSMYPPGAFDSAATNYLPVTATKPLPEADDTGSSLYPPGAFYSSDNIHLPASIIEIYPEADETGSSLHPPGAFNSSDVIDRSTTNIGLQQDATESCDESVEAGDSSYYGDGSLSDSDAHLSLDDREEPLACEIHGIPRRPGILEQGPATSRALYLELQDGYLTDPDEHDSRPTTTEAARLEEMYGYLRSLLALEPNSDVLDGDDDDDGTAPISSTSRALPDILVYVEPRRLTLEPSIVPPSLPRSEKDSDSTPVAGKSRLAIADKVDAALITPGNAVGDAPSTDRSMRTMQPILIATNDLRPCHDLISPLEYPLVNENTLEASGGSLKTTRTPQDVEGYRASGHLCLHDLDASVHDYLTSSHKASTRDDHAAIPSPPKLASSASISIADPSPWGTAPATRGIRRLTMTSPRVLLRKGGSSYELHHSPEEGLRSIASRQTNSNPHHSIIGLLQAQSTPPL